MNTRQVFYDYLRLLESKDAGSAEKLTKMIAEHKREGQRFWRILANFRDFRAGKTLLMFAAAANSIELSDMLDPWCDIAERDASGRLCTHYAALTDSVEWLHNMHKRHGETAVFFTRDFTQQRPVDTATTFKAYRAKRWLEMLQAEEIMKANLDGTLRSFMDIVSSKKLDPVAVFDHLAELYASKNPTLTSEGGSDATQKG
jgi:hypothetical protein